MKLIYCRKCQDVVRLFPEVLRQCKCGACWGRYLDDRRAEFGGEFAVPLGIAWRSFALAQNNQPDEAPGERFEAFVIEHNCPTFRRVPAEGDEHGDGR